MRPGSLPRVSVSVFPTEDRIPQKLHQTFRSRVLAPELQDSVNYMRSVNPGWEYRFYDDFDARSYILKYYGSEFLCYFDAINPKYSAARADLFRYCVLYRDGGVYLDVKSRATKPFAEILKPSDRFLLSQWGGDSRYQGWGVHRELRKLAGGEFQQWFIVAAPGHPFLRAVIEAVLRNIRSYDPMRHSIGKPAVVRVTGPIAYTLAIAPLLSLHSHRIVDSAADLGFEYSIYPKRDHEAALGAHYSEIGEPLVGSGLAMETAAALRRSYKVLRRALKGA